MADLFTHLVAARVPACALSHPRLVALFVIGTFLPDLAAKGLFWVARTAPGHTVPTHSILGVLLLSYVASLFIDSGFRGQAFGALCGFKPAACRRRFRRTAAPYYRRAWGLGHRL